MNNYLCRLTAAIVMAITYGYDITLVEDQFVGKVERFLKLFLQEVTYKRTALMEAVPFRECVIEVE